MALHVGAAGPFPRLADLATLPFSAGAYGGEWGPLAAATAFPRITDHLVFPSSAGASGGEREPLAAAVQGAGAYTIQSAAGFSLPPVGGAGARHEYCSIKSALRLMGRSSDVLHRGDYWRTASTESLVACVPDQDSKLNWATQQDRHATAAASEHATFVGELAYDITKSMLRHPFKSRSLSVKDEDVIFDKLTDRSKGHGFVSSGDANEHVQAATEMNGGYFSIRPMYIAPAYSKKSNPAESNITASMGADLVLMRRFSGTSAAGAGAAAAAASTAAGGAVGGGGGGAAGDSFWVAFDRFLGQLGYVSVRGPVSRAFLSLAAFTVCSQGVRELGIRGKQISAFGKQLLKDDPLEVQQFMVRALGYIACDFGWDCFYYESE